MNNEHLRLALYLEDADHPCDKCAGNDLDALAKVGRVHLCERHLGQFVMLSYTLEDWPRP